MNNSDAAFASIVSAVATGYLVTFISAAFDARRGSVKGRVAAFVVGLIAVAGLALLAFLAVIGDALRCDDSCDDRSPNWRNTATAWQWHDQLIVALVALLFAISAVMLLALRKERPASLAAALTTACVAAWGFIMLS